MNANEFYYRRVIGAIGLSLLLFWGLINLFGVGLGFFSVILSDFFPPASVSYQIIYQVVYAIGYLLCFMLPVCLMRGMIIGRGYPYQPMKSQLRVSKWIFLLIPAGIAIIFAAATVNASMVSVFDYSNFSSDNIWGNMGEKSEPYQIVLDFLVICLVPGFCEEFLFRGAILTNCLPFGRTNAILISSFLFALMHQNAEQIFYAFVAGIFLGLVYERTGSIWNCTLLHVINNFVSITEGVIFSKPIFAYEGSLLVAIFEILLFIFGIISLVILIARFASERNRVHGGFFGRDLPALDSYAQYPIASGRAVRLFLTPSMVLFIVLCAVQIIFLIATAVLYGSV